MQLLNHLITPDHVRAAQARLFVPLAAWAGLSLILIGLAIVF